METIYIETTVVSYLVANPSRDPILAAHQQITRQWWQNGRKQYECVTSEEVLREASLGDTEMSRRRGEALSGLTVLAVDDTARELARAVLAEKILPPTAVSDAIHAVVASQHRVDILNLELSAPCESPFACETTSVHSRARAGFTGDLHSH